MDGKRLSRQLRQMMNEEEGSNYIDPFTTFDLLNQAASKLNDKIEHLKATQDITTIADTPNYTLNADYMRLDVTNAKGRELIRYDDGETLHYIPRKDDDVRVRNKTFTTESRAVPSSFDIMYDATVIGQVTGTETTGGALSAGKAALIDSTAPFANVQVNDTIHNTTDGAMGVVLSKTSTSQIVCAMFDGTNNFFTNGDAYVINPQARYRVLVDPPCETAGDTIRLWYLKRPDPVYSDYDAFPFPIHFQDALIFYAVGFYKYRMQMNEIGNTWFIAAENLLRQYNKAQNSALGRRRVTVNFKKPQRNY